MSDSPAPKREWAQWELDFVSVLDNYGAYVLYFMQATMGIFVLVLLYRFYDIYCEFVDPVKKKEREEARRARDAKKDE